MICAIHQPNFLPWLGYFDKIKQADIFIFMDNAQYTQGTWINRCYIRKDKNKQWLTVPVLHSGRFGQKISETETNYKTNWAEKHLKTLELDYGKAPYFKKYFPDIKKILEQKHKKLADMNIRLIKKITEWLKSETRFIKGSELKVEGIGTNLLINMVKAAGGDTYLCGGGAEGYQEDEKFGENNIKLIYQNFQHPIYKQQSDEFIPGISIIDFLFNASV